MIAHYVVLLLILLFGRTLVINVHLWVVSYQTFTNIPVL